MWIQNWQEVIIIRGYCGQITFPGNYKACIYGQSEISNLRVMNSRATDNLVNKVHKSVGFLKLSVCFYIWVSYDLQLFIKTNRSVQHSLVRETKQIVLLGSTSQCHTFLSLSSILITQCCTLKEESCLVTTVHFNLNPLAVLFSVAIFQLILLLKDSQSINPLAPTGRTLIHICSLHVEIQDLSIKIRVWKIQQTPPTSKRKLWNPVCTYPHAWEGGPPMRSEGKIPGEKPSCRDI